MSMIYGQSTIYEVKSTQAYTNDWNCSSFKILASNLRKMFDVMLPYPVNDGIEVTTSMPTGNQNKQAEAHAILNSKQGWPSASSASLYADSNY